MSIADRVNERRRAVALARHYRDQEGLSVAEIAARLGRAPATIRGYFYDPTAEKNREWKAAARGRCESCGAPTTLRGGRDAPYEHCNGCHPGARVAQWSRARVREAMRDWNTRYGTIPSSYDWSRTHATRRGGDAIARLTSGKWPTPNTVTRLYGTWSSASADAFPLEPSVEAMRARVREK